MAQSGYTPIQLYYSTTAAAVPVNTNLASGELALNIQDEKLYFKNAAGTVKLLASNATSAPVTSFQTSLSGLTPSTATTGAVTLAGTLGTANGGTNLGGATPFTSGGVVYASSTSALATGSGLYFSGTNLGVGTNSPIATQSGVDISSGGLALVIGADNGSSTRTNAGNKSGRFAMAHYTNAEEPFAIALCDVTSTTNELSLGGGSGACNTATVVKFFTAADNTTVSGSERMRITSAGNLGIGTSSPSSKLEVSGADSQLISKVTNTNTAGQAASQLITNTAALYSAAFGSTAGGTTWAGLTGNSQTVIEAQNSSSLVIGTFNNSAPIVFAQGRAEKIRIDTAGNLGIGTSSPNNNLEVLSATNPSIAVTSTTSNLYCYYGMTAGTVGGQLYTFGQSYSAVYPAGCTALANNTYGIILNASNATGILRFQTNDTERARISAAGGFSVGTTADPGAGAIYATGNITAYYSDARLKTVSGKIENALDKVAQLSGVYYTNNDVAKSFGYENDEEQVGVLAQDVEAVLPQIVKAAPFDLDENGNSKSGENYKTVQYERLVPLLIEAINELRAEVKALKGA